MYTQKGGIISMFSQARKVRWINSHCAPGKKQPCLYRPRESRALLLIGLSTLRGNQQALPIDANMNELRVLFM
jgi:hypothetical protein